MFFISFKVAMTARKELLENIRQYPGDEGSDENNFRKTMNSIQKRVQPVFFVCFRKINFFLFSSVVVVSINIKIGLMLMYGLDNHMYQIHAVLKKQMVVENKLPRMKLMV